MIRATVVLVLLGACAVLRAQDGDGTAFDVVSIRPNESGGSISMRSSPGRWVGTNINVGFLLITAYRVPPDAILNTPNWVDRERFDVEATFTDPEGATATKRGERHRARMRALLADRFGAVIRQAEVETEGYALVLARNDGTLGPQMSLSLAACRPDTSGSDREPPPASVTEARARPDRQAQTGCSINSDQRSIRGRGMTMDMLVRALAMRVGTVLLDRTGLEGRYDFELNWTPDPLLAPGVVEPSPDSGPSIFTAVVEQLGLRLEPAELPGAAIYVERIERPTPN